MAVLIGDIQLYKSTSGLGGSITATAITTSLLHDVFDPVSNDEASAGDTEYRCVYIKNTNATGTLFNASIYISSTSSSADSDIFIGLGTSAISATEQSIGNESTAPTGVTFTNSVGEANELAIGNLAPSATKAIWFKRVVDPVASYVLEDAATVTIAGEVA